MELERIKYRAKDKFTGRWVYGFPRKTALGNWVMYDGDRRYCIVPETLGRYVTTLNDKEVFENDLIYVAIPASDVADVPLGSGLYYHNILEVWYNEENASYYPFDEFKGYCEYVAGNVHDKVIRLEDKQYKAVFEGNERPVNECEGCALKDAKVCWGGTEFCNAFQDEDHTYWHFELITFNNIQQ